MRSASCFRSVLLLVAVCAPQARALNGPTSTATNLQVRKPGRTASRRGFQENLGQWPDSIQFRAESNGSVLWFTCTGVYCEEFHAAGSAPTDPLTTASASTPGDIQDSHRKIELSHAWFEGANPKAHVNGVGRLDYYSNYFLGNDERRWRGDVPSFESIIVHDLYPGVDVEYSLGLDDQLVCATSNASQLELQQIRWRTDGRTGAFQQAEESLNAGPGRAQGDHFSLLAEASARQEAAMAPQAAASPVSLTIYYLKSVGGPDGEASRDVAVNKLGEACVVGYCDGASFPTVNPYQTDRGSIDVVVSKVSADGTTLLYSTYLGGSAEGFTGIANDFGTAIDVDTSNNIYVVGNTVATDFPIMNQFQTDKNARDGFVTKLSAAGNTLVYSTYLGNAGLDDCNDIFVDASGAAYVVGYTTSDNFPTVNPYQSTKLILAQAAFLTKLSPSGSSAMYSTFLGGFAPAGSHTWGLHVQVDDSGCAFVVGQTECTDFPAVNAIQGTYQGGTTDCFITKFTANGSSVHYSTYLGGTNADAAAYVALDDSDQAVVGATSSSTDYPMVLPYQTDQGQEDIVISKLNAAGTALKFSTYLGGSTFDSCSGIAVMADGAIVISGNVSSGNFPVDIPIPGTSVNDGQFALTRLAPSLDHLIYSTFLKPGAVGLYMDVDPQENVYLTNRLGPDIGVAELRCPISKPGDLNVSGAITSADVILLVNYVFKSGAEPVPCASSGDVNCNSTVTSSDVIGLVNFVFKSGKPPCNPCVCR